ncbi:glycogen debranching N-terminal domain-containing protein [Sorangium sp. So ce426]|uniref:glycogen debranching N-terminal domain-containing protein n=1 Tax=Sorangium sp. So ce426 TaxID=3133312 RepID=UPI003F5B994A
MAQSIADAVVLKEGGVFLVTDQRGAIPLRGEHGFGLYYRDCRFLNGYCIELDGIRPEALASTAEAGHAGTFQLSNPELRMRDGHLLSPHEVGIRWERIIDGAAAALYEEITIHNYARSAIELEVRLTFRAEFEDIYVVRGLTPEALGELRAPAWDAEELRFSYDGADRRRRAVTVRWARRPDAIDGTSASFRVRLPPGRSQPIPLVITLSEFPAAARNHVRSCPDVDVGAARRRAEERSAALLAERAHIETDSLLVNRVLARSFADLRLLRTPLGQDMFFAAGVPWFTTLFGRDSLITALEVLPFRTDIAADTLQLLARFQAREQAPRRDGVFGGIVRAAMHFRMYRLPELFCGFARDEYGGPVRYPVSCHPQAWAAGAVPYMLASLLGLEPEGFERRLRVVRPVLPRLVRRATVRGLTVADGRVDLDLRRAGGDRVEVDVLRVEGNIDVVVEER